MLFLRRLSTLSAAAVPAQTLGAALPASKTLTKVLRAGPGLDRLGGVASPDLAALARHAERLAPELAWEARRSLLKRLRMVGSVDHVSRHEARDLANRARALEPELGDAVADLFEELAAVKVAGGELGPSRSLAHQMLAAEQAAKHLEATIHAHEAHALNPVSQPSDAAAVDYERLRARLAEEEEEEHGGGLVGAVSRIRVRHQQHARAMKEQEGLRALTALLLEEEVEEVKAADGDSRLVEFAVADREAKLQQELAEVVERLEAVSLRLLVEEREEADNLEALW
ncbi:hypothetical protein EMIHUDRAFT_103163 [Emiliania huxleyi CCMP1516]|uniref:Uncharacterized protein n=2 Tax=Emiliania huxleyi TaxID=2903 RepID=A0A0D3IWJ9_EMIH1|nr:hypothetical protein EMIHUDRAFT_103163 [Emiliania huxleyi CCMP1516]EOD15634.1 hypothetical protein EMIHUDRAFT_103163 [Emiliania huxleyi CCMP1516]|eukprot:XP_005768063.1 hypothetical protein EMIHUDRAFT_103163 [Emiliania huxleyi CCMP1516]